MVVATWGINSTCTESANREYARVSFKSVGDTDHMHNGCVPQMDKNL